MTETCTWIGEGKLYDSTCCSPVVEGRNYCEQHLWAVYQKGTATHRRKDTRTAQAVWDIEGEFNAAVQELMDEGYDFDELRWAPEAETIDT
jgi:hypothetical protein